MSVTLETGRILCATLHSLEDLIDPERSLRGIIQYLSSLAQVRPQKTIRSIQQWNISLEAAQKRAESLRKRMIGEPPEEYQKVMKLVADLRFFLKISIPSGYLDTDPYYFSSQVLSDLRMLSCGSCTIDSSTPLGVGHHSIVYAAELDGTPRAVKVFFEKEAKALYDELKARVKFAEHPNIITSGAVIKIEGVNYGLLVEKALGDCKHLFTDTTKDSPIQLQKLFTSVASALLFLHKSKMVYNGLKPQNIVVRADGSFALADFGRASPFGSILKKSALYYCPLEFFDEPPCTGTHDIFAFGSLLFFGLTGKRLFEDPFKEYHEVLVDVSSYEVSVLFQKLYPTDASREFVRIFGEKAFEYFPLIDYIFDNSEFFLELMQYSDEIGSKDLLEKITRMERVAQILNIESGNLALIAKRFQLRFPSDDFKELFQICEKIKLDVFGRVSRTLHEMSKSTNPLLSIQHIKAFLKIPKAERNTMYQMVVTQLSSSMQMRATLIDPKGDALHLAERCIRFDPLERPTSTEILKHPYVTKEGTIEAWEEAYVNRRL